MDLALVDKDSLLNTFELCNKARSSSKAQAALVLGGHLSIPKVLPILVQFPNALYETPAREDIRKIQWPLCYP
jgi:hypothetical protein